MVRLALLLALVPVVLAAQSRHRGEAAPPAPPPLLYCNERFSFGINVPDGLTEQPPPANGDGATWLSADSSVEFRAWGENDVMSMKEMMELAAERMAKTAVKRKGRDWFVVSGTLPDKRILYRRTRMQNDVWVSFELIYPSSQRKTYDPMCGELAESMITCLAVSASDAEDSDSLYGP